MREHDPFRLARRPRSVDDRRQVAGADRAERAVEDFWLGAVEFRAPLLQLEERQRALVRRGGVRVEEDDAFEPLDRLDAWPRVAEDLAARDEEEARAGVFEDVAHLLGGLRRVDGDVDRAEAEYCEVDDGPVGPVLRQQGHAVALPDAERGESQGDCAHAPDDRVAGDVEPLPLPLQAHRVRLGVP